MLPARSTYWNLMPRTFDHRIGWKPSAARSNVVSAGLRNGDSGSSPKELLTFTRTPMDEMNDGAVVITLAFMRLRYCHVTPRSRPLAGSTSAGGGARADDAVPVDGGSVDGRGR